MGPAARFDRPQRFDRGALGRRVPCRLRDALGLGFRCGGSGVTTICSGSTLRTHSHGMRRPSLLARSSRSIKLPGPHISATTRPLSQWTSCTRPSLSPSSVRTFLSRRSDSRITSRPARDPCPRAVLALVQAELSAAALELHGAADVCDLRRAGTRVIRSPATLRTSQHSPARHAARIGAGPDQQRLEPHLLARRRRSARRRRRSRNSARRYR